MLSNFNCAAAGVEPSKDLSDPTVLEQFKNTLPERIATYVNDHKASDVLKAAASVDDYVLTHKIGGEDRFHFDIVSSAGCRLNEMPQRLKGAKNSRPVFDSS